MKNKILNKEELREFITHNYSKDKIIIEGVSHFFEDLNSIGIHYKEIIEILVLGGMYEYDEKLIEKIKNELLNFEFIGNYEIAPDFDVNKSYYTFYQIQVNYSKKAILLGYYSPLGFKYDIGFNWLKVINHAYYNLGNVKDSYIEFTLNSNQNL